MKNINPEKRPRWLWSSLLLVIALRDGGACANHIIAGCDIQSIRQRNR